MGVPDVDVLAAVIAGTFAKLVGLAVVARNRKAKFEKVGTVSALYLYPVKSCGVLEKQEALCTHVGLNSDGLYDRQWMILDDRDETVTMKEVPRITQITSSSVGQFLRLKAPDMPHLDLPKMPNLKTAKPFRLTDQNIPIVDCGAEAAKWISNFIGRQARLVFSCPELGTRDAFDRKRDWGNTARQGDVSVFAYLTAYMVTSEASLRKINSELSEPVSSVHFRPNIVIENEIPFDEDNWMEMGIGKNALFHSVEPCLRCIITTTDPKTGVRDKTRRPIKLLKSFRCKEPYGRDPVFGNYMALDVQGQVKIGDPVYVIRKSEDSSS